MKKKSFVIAFLMGLTGLTFAASSAASPMAGVVLPQSSTIFICTAGLPFVHLLSRHLKRIP